jgi:hypothetical protein
MDKQNESWKEIKILLVIFDLVLGLLPRTKWSIGVHEGIVDAERMSSW